MCLREAVVIFRLVYAEDKSGPIPCPKRCMQFENPIGNRKRLSYAKKKKKRRAADDEVPMQCKPSGKLNTLKIHAQKKKQHVKAKNEG